MCFLDMISAFDIVYYSLLLMKLEMYGFDSLSSFYTIFTNELPEIAHEQSTSRNEWPDYKMSCKVCGCVACYADDTTYTC